MNVAIKTQEVASAATEQAVQYVFVEDTELVHIGGGVTGTVYL